MVIGCGYVGLTTGACLAEIGNEVVCVDRDLNKIRLLKNGKSPIYEQGLEELIVKNAKDKRLFFTDEIDASNCDVVFCAVGTPTEENGETDLSDVFEVAKKVGESIKPNAIFIIKSTVPVGTTLQCKRYTNSFIAFNPEFLRQGSAVKDTMNPDRIIVGTDHDEVKEKIKKLYKPFLREDNQILFMDIASAELAKYAANAFLSMKISFINEIADLCDASGANIHRIAEAIGLDKRIGMDFLRAGIGYGGSCLGKDNRSLINQAGKLGKEVNIIKAVEDRNEKQKKLILKKLQEYIQDLNGKTIALLGLSFKPGTDDLRDAPSQIIIEELKKAGAQIKAYDPVSKAGNKENNAYDTVKNADALVLLTEWDEFKNLDFVKVKTLMKGNLLIDGRNIYDPILVKKAGLKYIGIGVS